MFVSSDSNDGSGAGAVAMVDQLNDGLTGWLSVCPRWTPVWHRSHCIESQANVIHLDFPYLDNSIANFNRRGVIVITELLLDSGSDG